MLTRFRTAETLLLLVLGLGLVVGACRLSGFGPGWTLAFALAFTLVAFPPLAMRLQDHLLELYVATGRFGRALAVARAIRNSALHPVARALAEFDLALVHLARGAPADAKRTLGRIERHRLKPRTRLLVELHDALATVRSAGPEARAEAGRLAIVSADAALTEFQDDAHVLAMKGEALLAAGDSEAARALLRHSLEIDGDPSDPSPGERLVLFARAAEASGAVNEAVQALRAAAKLRARGPFVEAARTELARLEPHA